MAKKRYSLGFDVGLNSLGLAAIELDENDFPVRILNAQSVIHDSGVDPDSRKTSASRLAQSGVARRARRLHREHAKRLECLDQLLEQLGFPIPDDNEISKQPYVAWLTREKLAGGYITDDRTRKMMLAIAIRHIARHRGWRNPYSSERSLFNISGDELSVQYGELLEAVTGEKEIPANPPTIGQLVGKYIREFDKPGAPRLRHGDPKHATKNQLNAVLPIKLMQSDNAYELRIIAQQQHLDEAEYKKIITAVFHQKSPKGSAEAKVGKDPFGKGKRALKASLAFQRFRIASTLANLRVRVPETKSKRPLSSEEKKTLYDRLVAIDKQKDIPTWETVCEWFPGGLARENLLGVAQRDTFGERISNIPPVLTSVIDITDAQLSSKEGKNLVAQLKDWWSRANDAEKEAMILTLSNTVDISKVENREEFTSVVSLLENLEEKELAQLDNIHLSTVGRAAYSTTTLNELTHQILNTEDDLRAALEHLYNVGPSWMPPQEEIGAPLGNPAADRVLKIVNRYLLNAEARWGKPVSVTIEHTRDGFISAKASNEYSRHVDNRYAVKHSIAEELKREGIAPNNANIRRWEAVQRQNGQCLYCGAPITYTTCEMDHIVPRKGEGGSDNRRTNFAAVCSQCNKEKSNIPFGSWVKTEAARKRGITLKATKARVDHFIFTFKAFDKNANSEYTSVMQRNFKKSMKARLEKKAYDDPLDERSIESVSWMADELHKRIDWHFNQKDMLSTENQIAQRETQVSVYPGSITAIARTASGIEGEIHFIGAQYKTRFDRRHHAVDAMVIAMMDQQAAFVLNTKLLMKQSQSLVGELAPDEVCWKKYPLPTTTSPARYDNYQSWLKKMDKLIEMMNYKLDHDQVPVVRWRRLQLGNGKGHDDTVHKLLKVRLGEAMTAELIRRASTPALYEALVSLPDYSPVEGLPEDSNRIIHVHGLPISADEEVGFFASTAAQVLVRHGSADVGNAIHHARVYRYYTENSKGVRKYAYGMIRVFAADLQHSAEKNLFTVPLRRSSLSMRYADTKVASAVLQGRAQFLGTLSVGDELHLDLKDTELKSMEGYKAALDSSAEVNPSVVNAWVVTGFFSNTRLRLRPMLISGEGLPKLERVSDDPALSENYDAVNKIVGTSAGSWGWLVGVTTVGSLHPVVIRRNSFGEPRWKSNAHLPVSYRWDSEHSEEE